MTIPVVDLADFVEWKSGKKIGLCSKAWTGL